MFIENAIRIRNGLALEAAAALRRTFFEYSSAEQDT